MRTFLNYAIIPIENWKKMNFLTVQEDFQNFKKANIGLKKQRKILFLTFP